MAAKRITKYTATATGGKIYVRQLRTLDSWKVVVTHYTTPATAPKNPVWCASQAAANEVVAARATSKWPVTSTEILTPVAS